MSLEKASLINNTATAILIVSLLVGTVATSLISWTANIKEQYSKREVEIAQKQTAEEKLARIKIEQSIADRKLTELQTSTIIEKVKSFSDQEFEMITFWDSREPLAFANQIVEALKKAGWKYIERSRQYLLLNGNQGIQVSLNPAANAKTKEAVDTLVAALNALKFDATIKQELSYEAGDNKIFVSVGTKR